MLDGEDYVLDCLLDFELTKNYETSSTFIYTCDIHVLSFIDLLE